MCVRDGDEAGKSNQRDGRRETEEARWAASLSVGEDVRRSLAGRRGLCPTSQSGPTIAPLESNDCEAEVSVPEMKLIWVSSREKRERERMSGKNGPKDFSDSNLSHPFPPFVRVKSTQTGLCPDDADVFVLCE